VYNAGLKQRLNALVSVDNEGGITDSLAAGLKDLDAKRQAIVHGGELVQLDSFRRKIGAIKMLIRRDYVHFYGLRSFLRDMLR